MDVHALEHALFNQCVFMGGFLGHAWTRTLSLALHKILSFHDVDWRAQQCPERGKRRDAGLSGHGK